MKNVYEKEGFIMKNTITHITEELTNRFNKNGWNPITLTMKPSGKLVTLYPCGYGKNMIIVDSDDLKLMNFFTLEQTAKLLDRFETYRQKEECGQSCEYLIRRQCMM